MKIYELNGDNITSPETFYDEISRICNFPDYFGRNLDALNDCLYDLKTEHPEGVQIYWLNVHPYLAYNADQYQLRAAQGDSTIQKNLLDHMKELCDGQGIEFFA